MKLHSPAMTPTEYEQQVINNAKREFDFLVEIPEPISHRNFAERIEMVFGNDMNAKLNEIVRVLKRLSV